MKHASQQEHTLPASLPAQSQEPTALQRRISEILDGYLTLIESGTKIDDERFLSQHKDLADELRPHLRNLRAMHVAVSSEPSNSDASAYEAPKSLGVYQLKREIGRGGQGIVYEAHDETLNRQVALKVLPFAALLDRKQIDRFINEAQAAAQLHHPNIVPVFAVGVDRGVHYYAMQYVEGAPLSVAIEQLGEASGTQRSNGGKGSTIRPGTTIEDRVAANSPSDPSSPSTLSHWISNSDAGTAGTTASGYRIDRSHFRQVANLGVDLAAALAHAHELGIVHRDIKPSNLLLDASGKAWIADFGLARISNDNTMTGSGDILGTIRYMSPEQARGRNAFVDHRTDIYSLGVTLYELLTLQPVFQSRNREDFMSQIGTSEPTRPRRINSAIPADLENIILRAIEPDPNDRYETAEEFSQDLQRFLNGQPTLARRAAFSDRAFKWARRHRRLVTTVAACLTVATIGFATATLLIANEQSKTAAALKEKDISYQRAQTNLNAARRMVNELGVQTSEALAGIPGTEQVRRDVLDKTKRYYDFLLTQSQDETLLHERGVTLTRSARINEQLGDLNGALKLYADAASELESVIAKDPSGSESNKYRTELLNCQSNAAMLLARTGKLDEAATALQQAVAKQQHLLKTLPDNEQITFDLACSQSNLAFILERAKEYEQSKSSYQAAIRLYRQAQTAHQKARKSSDSTSKVMSDKHQRQFALVLHNLSALLAHEDRSQAKTLCTEAIEIQRGLMDGGNHAIGLRSELAISLDRMAELQMLDNRHREAEKSYLDALTVQRRLVALSPADLSLHEDLAITLNHLGDLYRETKTPAKAEKVFAEAAQLLNAMVEMAPKQASFRSSLGAVLYNQGSALMELDKKDQALRLWNEGLSHQQAAVDQAPSIESFRSFLDRQKASLMKNFPKRN